MVSSTFPHSHHLPSSHFYLPQMHHSHSCQNTLCETLLYISCVGRFRAIRMSAIYRKSGQRRHYRSTDLCRTSGTHRMSDPTYLTRAQIVASGFLVSSRCLVQCIYTGCPVHTRNPVPPCPESMLSRLDFWYLPDARQLH